MNRDQSSDYQISDVENESSLENSHCLEKEKKNKLKLRKQRIYRQKTHGAWT